MIKMNTSKRNEGKSLGCNFNTTVIRRAMRAPNHSASRLRTEKGSAKSVSKVFRRLLSKNSYILKTRSQAKRYEITINASIVSNVVIQLTAVPSVVPRSVTSYASTWMQLGQMRKRWHTKIASGVISISQAMGLPPYPGHPAKEWRT